MAPTETLAEQHFLTVEGICNELGVRCELLTSSVPAAQRRAVRDRLASGETDLAVGTHALIQEEVEFRSLAVAVVDEQHRFGVEQRRALGRTTPHVLHMTATPIPRTLAQTVFGDLDVTEIAKPPANRKPVITSWVGHERSSAVHPPAQAPRGGPPGLRRLPARLRVGDDRGARGRAGGRAPPAAELRGFRVGVLHGKLKTAERREVMGAFKRRELDVLVATTVIEVGVDVPNATIMIVQEADRFGLAQLHQLRGRVGRGAEQSYCLLVSRPKEELTEDAVRRLEALVETSDGFRLAEVDLELRGEGQLLGVRQSGLSDLKFARLARDRPAHRQGAHLGRAARGRGGRRSSSRCGRRRSWMRIIAGSRKGARIFAPKGLDTRPTGDRVREAVFNLVGPVDEAEVLDLYAGSGAMGLEALSRRRPGDLRRVRPQAAETILRNLDKLRLEGAVVLARTPGASWPPTRRGQALRSRAGRPPYAVLARDLPSSPPTCPPSSRRTASPSSSPTPARSPELPLPSGRAAATARHG